MARFMIEGRQRQFVRKFCAVAGLDTIVDDPRFRTNEDERRTARKPRVHVESASAQNPVEYWKTRCGRRRSLAERSIRSPQLLEHRTQGQAELSSSTSTRPQAGCGEWLTRVLIDGAERHAGCHRRCMGRHTDEV